MARWKFTERQAQDIVDLRLGQLTRLDGIKLNDSRPLHFKPNERLRVTFVNDTMMAHPMHLHGMWSDLEDEDGRFLVRKHTVDVPPGTKRTPAAPLRYAMLTAMNSPTSTPSIARRVAAVREGGAVESMHRGAVAVLDAEGTVHTALGDIDRPIFPRSAVKPRNKQSSAPSTTISGLVSRAP